MADHQAAGDHFRTKLAHETDPSDLRAMLHERDDVVVVDARSESAYMQEHIPRAMSFPYAMMDAASTSKLNRQRLYVTYCDGVGCNASTKGALKLAELGFNVKELIGGIEWWKRDGYPTENCSVALNLS